MSDQLQPNTVVHPGTTAAILVYVLYLLSIPSAGVLALVGLVIAYSSIDGAAGLGRSHLENAIKIWWLAFWWAIGLGVLCLAGWAFAFVLIGLPLIAMAWALGIAVAAWFVIASVMGLLALSDGRMI